MLILVRHARTAWNAAKQEILRGHFDPPIDSEGWLEAEKLGQRLCDRRILEVWSSHFQRDRQTGEIIARRCKVPLVIIPGMAPWDIGDFSGQPRKAVWGQIAQIFANPALAAPHGETGVSLLNRWGQIIRAGLEKSRAAKKDLIQITQGTVIRALPTILYGRPMRTDKFEYVSTGEVVYVG